MIQTNINNIFRYVLGLALVLLLSLTTWAQNAPAGGETREVTATGQGLDRDQALQDALRNAVAQAAGIAVQSQTKVENFVTVQDAIATHASGYITTYKVANERKLQDAYSLTVVATVSMKPLKADANLLAKSIGGVRFLVTYEERNHDKDENKLLDYATERINQFLSQKKYRYVEKKRTDKLRTEASNMMQEGLNQELGYAQQLALMADAQFIIYIKNMTTDTKEEAFGTRTRSTVGLEVKAYDNCTGEGLGTITLHSDEMVSADNENGKRKAIESAIERDGDKLISTFTTYIGDWVNNGTPFELRFYDGGGFRELRELRTGLKADASFGGDMEIVGADDFQKLNCTFRKKPDELADKVLDVADGLPAWKAKKLDVKYIYGRQISFAPRNYKIPGYTPAAPEGFSADKPSASTTTEAPAETAPANTKALTKAPATRTVKKPSRRK